MLELLSLRKGTTLTKEMFLNHLYGGMDEPELKIIDVFICKLRKKLATATERRELHRDGVGPRLRAARPEGPDFLGGGLEPFVCASDCPKTVVQPHFRAAVLFGPIR